MDARSSLAVVAFVIVVVLAFLYLSIRVVKQYERMVVFRLGPDERGAWSAGRACVFLVPIVDRPVKVDLREQFIEVPSQTTITKDNAPINVDFLIYWRIVDPLKSVVNVRTSPARSRASRRRRCAPSSATSSSTRSCRSASRSTRSCGSSSTRSPSAGAARSRRVEIREITPPRDVQDAMNRQLSAERTRRAVITESEGTRQAAINVAEGQKQSEILKAEGERQAAILRAEGFGQALERIFWRPATIDQKTMALQYLEALKALGASPSTKFVIPTEFTRLIEPIVRLRPRGDGRSSPRRRSGAPPATPPAPRPRAGDPAGLLAAGSAVIVAAPAGRVATRDAARGRAAAGRAAHGARRRRRSGRRSTRWAARSSGLPVARRPAPGRRAGSRAEPPAGDDWQPSGRARRSCCSTGTAARSRRTSWSTGRSCGERPACWASTSGATAGRTTRRRRSGFARSRTWRARSAGSGSTGFAGWPSWGRRWAA